MTWIYLDKIAIFRILLRTTWIKKGCVLKIEGSGRCSSKTRSWQEPLKNTGLSKSRLSIKSSNNILVAVKQELVCTFFWKKVQYSQPLLNGNSSFSMYHRRRTCNGYFPNSLKPISYLRYIWDLYETSPALRQGRPWDMSGRKKKISLFVSKCGKSCICYSENA